MAASRIPHQHVVALDARLAMAAANPVIVRDTVVIGHGRFLRAGEKLRPPAAAEPAHERALRSLVKRASGAVFVTNRPLHFRLRQCSRRHGLR